MICTIDRKRGDACIVAARESVRTGNATIMTDRENRTQDIVTIKKYANRRLYNTATSSYVTLDHLAQMVKDGTEFVVYEAKTGDDITHTVLTQIIMEEEGKGQNLLPIGFLRQLIGFYGDSLQGLVPRYLEHSMTAFAHNQQQMRTYMQDAMQGMFPFSQFDELNRQNMALFERTMRMFSPFHDAEGDGAPAEPADPPQPGDATDAGDEPTLKDLRDQLDGMRRQLDALSKQDG